MAKKDDMDHMRSILGHAASQVKPARMPSPNVDSMVKLPSSGPFSGKATPARMPQRDTGISTSDAAALNKKFGTNIKPGTKPKYK